MGSDKYIDWKTGISQFKREIEAEMMRLMCDRQLKGLLRLNYIVSVPLKNGDLIKVSLLEFRNDTITYYAGPVPYKLDELTVEGMNEIYFSLMQTLENLQMGNLGVL